MKFKTLLEKSGSAFFLVFGQKKTPEKSQENMSGYLNLNPS